VGGQSAQQGRRRFDQSLAGDAVESRQGQEDYAA
jgi:hypothetical protein